MMKPRETQLSRHFNPGPMTAFSTLTIWTTGLLIFVILHTAQVTSDRLNVRQYDVTSGGTVDDVHAAAAAGSVEDRSTRLIRLAVDSVSGLIYVASSTDVLYRFSPALQLQDRLSIGGGNEELTAVCGSAGSISGRSRSNVTGSTAAEKSSSGFRSTPILAIDFNSRRLLYCGLRRCGLCSVIRADGSKFSSPGIVETMDHADPMSYLRPSESSASDSSPVALYSSRHRGTTGVNSTSVLFVVGSSAPSSEALSARVVTSHAIDGSTKRSPAFRYRHFVDDSTSTSRGDVVDLLPTASSDSFRYIHAFDDERFVYFLVVRTSGGGGTEAAGGDPPPSRIETREIRLVRVCREAVGLESYSELKLSCKHRTLLARYFDAAVAATVAPIGDSLTQRLNDGRPGEDALYLVAEELTGNGLNAAFPRAAAAAASDDAASTRQPLTAPPSSYGVCVYPLSAVRREFERSARDCYSGNGRILPWINRNQTRCQVDADVGRTINEHFCSSPVNVGIDSRYALNAESIYTDSEHRLTSIAVVNYSKQTVAMLGTASGHLLKVAIDSTNQPLLATLNLVADLAAPPPPVEADLAFDPSHEHVYALTGSRISRIPVVSCSIYSTCDQCVTTRDPLQCGWCKDHCSTHAECMRPAAWTKDSCPPVFHSFEPTSGPVSGGTRVTITGRYFGDGSRPMFGVASVTVKVALEDCAVEHRNTSTIICQTGRSTHGAIEHEVKVTVIDRSKTMTNFDIYGEDTSTHTGFSYKDPSVTRFSPQLGPKSGGTAVSIHGTNLDIGSSLTVRVASRPCFVESISPQLVVCKTASVNSTISRHPLITRRSPNFSGSVTSLVIVTIDSTKIVVNDSIFSYVSDPVVYDIYPRRSILSGGLPVTVNGSNLNAVQKPMLQFTASDGRHLFSEPCLPSSNGTSTICITPDVSSFGLSPTLRHPLFFNVSFEMDGNRQLQSDDKEILIVMDPAVFKYPTGRHGVRWIYNDVKYLDFQGEHLDLAATPVDFTITVGDVSCNVTQLTSSFIRCQMLKFVDQLETDTRQHRVEVRVGNKLFNVGFARFAGSSADLALWTIVIVCPAVGLVAAVIVACCIRRRCQLRKMKSMTKTEYNINYVHAPTPLVGPSPENTLSRGLQSPTGINLSSTVFPVNQWPLQGELSSDVLMFPGDSECLQMVCDAGVLIDRDKLLLRDIIGQGHFGCVYRGVLSSDDHKSETEVAVKTLKMLSDDTGFNAVEARQFIEEALRMKEFDHVNVLRLVGVALDVDGLPLVILPYMRHGDLLSYIRNEANRPTVRQLIGFAIEIARGMAYLSNLKFVHRDLAARNCMLDDEMHAKVADFGLSRDIYERDYYSCDNRRNKLPVKWMALESLEKGIYNSRTDVWSFGIVLWELMTRGVCPYPDVDNWDIVNFLKRGRRLPPPPYCPKALYDVMQQCWNVDPKVRPSFDRLVSSVTEILDTMLHARLSSSGAGSRLPSHLNYGSIAGGSNASTCAPVSEYLIPNDSGVDCRGSSARCRPTVSDNRSGTDDGASIGDSSCSSDVFLPDAFPADKDASASNAAKPEELTMCIRGSRLCTEQMCAGNGSDYVGPQDRTDRSPNPAKLPWRCTSV